jgi:hypothetical protein
MDTIEKLSGKIYLCKHETIAAWWGVELPTTPSIIEWDDNGCFLISPHSITYCDFSIGRTQKISRKINLNDWSLFQKIYLDGWNSKLFRTDLPAKREVISINGEDWEYTETVRPGPGNGEIVPTEYKSSDDITLEIDAIYNFIKSAISLSPTIPLIRFNNLRRDDVGVYFYSDWGDWIHSPQFVIKNLLHSVRNYIGTNFRKFEDADTVYSQIENKWNSLL